MRIARLAMIEFYLPKCVRTFGSTRICADKPNHRSLVPTGQSFMVWIMFALFAAPTSVLAQQQNASGQSADQQLEIGGPAVIPDLEQAFTRERGEAAREFLAAALIDLGDTKQEYFDYVATRAASAVASGLPSPVQLGTREEPAGSPPRLNAAFVHWVRLHDIGLESAVQQATFEIPTAVEALGAEHLIADPVLLHHWRVEVKERGWKKAMRDTGQ
jgi:hypothetical protein